MASAFHIFVLITLLPLTIFAQNKCFYFLQDPSKAKLTWTAYKTPKKVGVDGSFSKITYTAQDTETLNDFLKSAKIEIESSSVVTGMKDRDVKIGAFFFKLMKNPLIKAQVKSIKDDTLKVVLDMNNVKKEIDMKYTYEKDILKLTGQIDILNWSMSTSLEALNKACLALHEKKTWSDVALKIEVPVKYECQGKL